MNARKGSALDHDTGRADFIFFRLKEPCPPLRDIAGTSTGALKPQTDISNIEQQVTSDRMRLSSANFARHP